MRSISCMLTEQQILDRTKDVTRRDGWAFLKPGDRLRAVRKCMGLKKGEKQVQLAVIEVVSVRRERLGEITQEDVVREGFPDMTPAEFCAMFRKHHKGVISTSMITRIEFKYVD